MTKRQQNLFQNLAEQIAKIYRNNKRQGKAGNERYKNSCYHFAKHLARHYNSQNFKNIRSKHLKSYIQESIKAGMDRKTLVTNLSGVRKLHSLLPKAKYTLPANHELNLPSAVKKEEIVDRAWTIEEYERALHLSRSMGRKDVAKSLQLARNFGVRINEATALHTNQLKNALKSNYLALTNTKNGVDRDVPVENIDQRVTLQEILTNSETGRIFIEHTVSHQQAKTSISSWIRNHRTSFQQVFSSGEEDREKVDCTFHGLRHTYAREYYHRNINEGMSERQARKDVAERLGHGRDAVTNKYL